MKNFLRYISRHSLWFPRGHKGWVMPRLNPLESCSQGANGKRTWYLPEPQWFWRLRCRIFGYAGEAMCGGYKYPSMWHRGPDGFRCSATIWMRNHPDCRRAGMLRLLRFFQYRGKRFGRLLQFAGGIRATDHVGQCATKNISELGHRERSAAGSGVRNRRC